MRTINYNFGSTLNIEQQLDLWGKLVYHHKVYFGRKYINTLREDKNPGCVFTVFKDMVCLVDFNYEPKTITLYHTLRQLYPETNFNLLIAENINKELVDKKNRVKTSETTLYFEKLKELTKDCLNYYNTYGINDLSKVNGYSVYKYYCNKFYDVFPEVCIGFELQNNKSKLYYPFRKENKWISTANESNYWFIEGNEKLYISTSHKDILVIHNLTGASVFSPMNETVKYTDHQLKLLSKFEEIYVVGDGDKQGQKFNVYNENTLNAKIIDLTPWSETENKYGKKCKDISEIYRLDKELCKMILQSEQK